jgi:UDP:flavonoid glycosyltransferase YjiC (YdhE family)
MRVLVSSTAGHGHVLPMVPLARALVAAGHDVLWATGADALPLVTEAGVEATAAGATQAEHAQARVALLERLGDVPLERRGEHVFPAIFGGFRTPLMLPGLLRIAREWRADLLLHEQGELAAPLVGRLLGLPHVVHAFGGASPATQVAAAAERVAGLWAERGLEMPPYAGCYQHLYLDICPSSVQTVDLAHLPARQPLRPGSYAGPDPAGGVPGIDDADGAPLVYLTLGTVQNRAPLFRMVLTGLAALDVRVLVTLGAGADPASVGPQPGSVTVRDWVPQSAVLPHAAVVVSHGGSGTVLATLAHGLPQVCVPQGADQFRNGTGVTRAGAGVSLPPERLTPDTVASAVRTLLDGPSYGIGARQVADEIAAMPSPADVVGVLEALA